MNTERIQAAFASTYQTTPLISRAPGRINIIGEHTDYNDGFVLPAAIDKEMIFALQKNNSDEVRATALDLNETESFSLNTPINPSKGWVNYVKGVTAELINAGVPVQGYDVMFQGDVPLGAGMSSSAALECALATGLNTLFEGGLDKRSLARAAQLSEHNYAGVQCGIMDQFASTFGEQHKVIKLDCRSLEFEYIPLNLKGYKMVLCDTKVEHNLASTEYNVRRQQCETGVELIQSKYPKVIKLRDVNLDMLHEFKDQMDPIVFQRCAYVIQENNRVQAACQALIKGDLNQLGLLMYQSHEGLSKHYEVSCPELDFLVKETKNNPAVLGARMMGGGFGGCTINLVKEDAIEAFVSEIAAKYQAKFNQQMHHYIVITGDGARVD